MNEVEDNGGRYFRGAQEIDPYQLFADTGFQLVRLRLWVNPHWSPYSTLPDVERSIARAKAQGMAVLLDLHYSDEWADPSKQYIPKEWEDLDDAALEAQVENYTAQVLRNLARKDLLPDMIQVGNETNQGMLKRSSSIDWMRQARLFNAGIRAVREAEKHYGKEIAVVLHIAQPENAFWWFREAMQAGITDFEVIGLSYYPQWSALSVSAAAHAISRLKQEFGKEVMVVEVGYPWTLDGLNESAGNVLTAGLRSYGISVGAQRQFMIDFSRAVYEAGGTGVVYWEPAWISSSMQTLWGIGSHYENATFFDFEGKFHEELAYPAQLNEIFGLAEQDGLEVTRLVDEEGDSFQGLPQLDILGIKFSLAPDRLELHLASALSLLEEPWGLFRFYLDSRPLEGAGRDPEPRPISVSGTFEPEYALDLLVTEAKGERFLDLQLRRYESSSGEWFPASFSGQARQTEEGYRLIIPRDQLGNPSSLSFQILSLGKGRAQTAADMLGSDWDPVDWLQEVRLEEGFRIF